jgi:hypothetical protein
MYNKEKVRLHGIVIPINILVLKITTTLDFQLLGMKLEHIQWFWEGYG